MCPPLDMNSIFLLFLACPFALAIWPIPETYNHGNATIWIDSQVKVIYSQPRHVSSVVLQSEETLHLTGLLKIFTYFLCNSTAQPYNSLFAMSIVQTAIDSTYQTLFFGNFIPWKFHPRSSDFEPSTVSKTFVASIALIQLQADSGNIFKAATADIDESYSLELSQNGNVTIIANSSIGIAHALTSFTQLFYAHSQGGGVYTPFMPISISDNPAFLHRGLNMDVSRNFFLVANIERTIDALAYNKFNRLHIHITDAQSWPIEIPSMPELAAKGAYGPGLTYSPSQLSQIQSYGALRGVQVYLEIDMPGHTSSIVFAFLDLIAAFNVQPNWYDYCAEPPCGTLKLNSSAVYDFLDALWGDILPRVSPYTSYFHTGGDEVNFDAYTLDETVHSSDPTVLHDLLQTFTDFNHDKIRAAGLTPIVWEEMLLNYNLTLGEDVVVQSWLGSASVASIVGKGYKALAGSHEFWVSHITSPFHL